jgi:hypothetical protein
MISRSCYACGALIERMGLAVCPRCGTHLEARWEMEPDPPPPVVEATDGAPVAAEAVFHLPGDDGTIEAALREELARRAADRAARETEWHAALQGRVDPMLRVLGEAGVAQRPILLQLEQDGVGTGAASVSIHVDERPARRVDARVAIALRRMRPETWETVGPTMADLRRDGVLRNFGWAIEVGVLASRSLELDPGDRAAVTELVDVLQEALDVAEVPLDAAWQFTVAEAEAAATSGLALDEAWVEDASAEQFRQRLVSLARLRGGRIVVRLARNEHFALGVTAQPVGDGVRVAATDITGGSDTGGHWRRAWTETTDLAGAPSIFAEVLGVLAERLPSERSAVALRLEERPAELGWQKAKDTGWLAGWILGLLLVLGPWALLTDIAHTDFLDALAAMVPGLNVRVAALLLVIPALSSMAFVFLTTGIAGRIADSRSVRYASGAWLIRFAAVIGSAAYFAALAVAGGLWLPVAVAPAIVLLAGAGLRLLFR